MKKTALLAAMGGLILITSGYALEESTDSTPKAAAGVIAVTPLSTDEIDEMNAIEAIPAEQRTAEQVKRLADLQAQVSATVTQ